jgi:signal transduction histidine kinase
VADDVLQLGDESSVTIAAELRRASGDPSLEVGFPLAGGDGYVDEAGRSIALPVAGSRRVVTPMTRDSRTVAVIVHDRRLETDSALADAIARAAELAAANAQLQADLLARVDEVRSSRRRIVEATDQARRSVERQLGADLLPELERLDQQLSTGVGDGAAAIDRARSTLVAVRAELDRLADDLHSPSIERTGLREALTELAARAPIATIFDDGGLSADALSGLDPARVTACWYVCSEALTNAAKHANATRVDISATIRDGALIVEVVDDGQGGVELAAGTGIRGLIDRVDAVEGSLRIESPSGGGTRLHLELPLGGS